MRNSRKMALNKSLLGKKDNDNKKEIPFTKKQLEYIENIELIREYSGNLP